MLWCDRDPHDMVPLLRTVFGPKREEVMGGWIRPHNEEFYKLYISPSLSRVINSRRVRWTFHVPYTWEMRNVYKIVVRKPEGKRPL
jgi:hypothetical protein